MARNFFNVAFSLYPKVRTIQEIANKIIDLLVIIGNYDKTFLEFNYSKTNYKKTEINITEQGISNSKEKLALSILNSNLKDIKEYEAQENPTLDFSREFGFSLLLQFKKKWKTDFFNNWKFRFKPLP